MKAAVRISLLRLRKLDTNNPQAHAATMPQKEAPTSPLVSVYTPKKTPSWKQVVIALARMPSYIVIRARA